MPAPKASDVGAALERVDLAIEALKAERKQYEAQAESMLKRGIEILGPTREYYLCPSTRYEVADGILAKVSDDVREQIATVDGAKARKLFELGQIPRALWSKFAKAKDSAALRFRKRKPVTPEEKEKALKAAA